MKKHLKTFISLLTVVALLSGCGLSNTLKGTAIGAGAGGVIGGAIGKQYGKTATGAILGAAIGGTAGALIGNYMDKQAEEMQRDLKNAKVERVGEGIKITFDSGILFKTGSAELGTTSVENIVNLGEILKKYDDTIVLIQGHTDSDGSESFNQTLSEKRANSVAGELAAKGVDFNRFTVEGFGEIQPVASNDTAEGKQLNRRVEIAIMANEELKKAAKDGKI